MIGISKLYCGTVEPSDALRYGRDSARLPSHLLQFSKDKLLDAMANDTELVHLWGAYLSGAIQEARHRAEILSRRSVAGRLDGWLVFHDQQLPDKGKWKQIATEIGVTPEALYREFAKRR